MRLTRTILGFTAVACLASAPVSADSHGHPSNAKPSPTQTQVVKPTKPDVLAGKRVAAKSPLKSRPQTATPTPTKPALNPIARKIASKPNLSAKINGMLPARADGTRMSLNEASKGFRNQGQFIAALHASQRSDCGSASCFTLIKKDMVERHMSLGQSIQDVRKTTPAASTTQAHEAEHEAERDRGEHHEREIGERHDTDHELGEHRENRQDGGVHRWRGEAHDNKIAKQIAANPQLSSKVQALLPAGTTLKKAARGFSSEREFLAALHASKDLNIPFAQIKAEMTGRDRDSLAQAIRELKPTADARTAARTARQEAAADLKPTA